MGSIFPSSLWLGWGPGEETCQFLLSQPLITLPLTTLSFFGRQTRKLPYQSSLQFIQRPQLLWNDIGDRKLWRGIQWIRHGPTVPSRLSWNAYQSNIPKPSSGVRWKHGMWRFSEYGNVASRIIIWYLYYIYTGDINIYYHIMTLPYITTYYHMFVVVHTHQLAKSPYHPEKKDVNLNMFKSPLKSIAQEN